MLQELQLRQLQSELQMGQLAELREQHSLLEVVQRMITCLTIRALYLYVSSPYIDTAFVFLITDEKGYSVYLLNYR